MDEGNPDTHSAGPNCFWFKVLNKRRRVLGLWYSVFIMLLQLSAVLTFLTLLTSAPSSAIHVDKCKDGIGSRDGSYGLGTIEDVRVTDCAESPCKLKKGSQATIEFDFKPDKSYDKLTTSVFGGIGIVRVPFREVHGMDACKDIKRKRDGLKGCPIEPTETYTYSNSFPILKSYPAVSVSVQYGLNDGKKALTCFTLPAKISN